METMKRFCALLLSVVMSASLCAPAAAAEVGDMVPVCGMEEHVHTGDCRSGDPLEDLISGSGAVKGETVYVVHQHGSGCYDGEGNLACVLMDEGHMSRYPDVVIVHKHDRNCTDCTLPESSYEVTDGMESVDSDSVYDHDSPHYVVGVPGDAHEGVNGVPEDMYLGYHTHGDGCDEGCTLPVVVEYVANGSGAYFCGKAEHVHADACFRKDSVIAPVAQSFGTCEWGTVNGITLSGDTWKLGDTSMRYIDVGVKVNLGSSGYAAGDVLVKLPSHLGIGRGGSVEACALDKQANGFSFTDDGAGNVVITNTTPISTGTHKSFTVYYEVDGWNIISGKSISLEYTVGGTSSTLPVRRIETGGTMRIENSGSFSPFGGADLGSQYLRYWGEPVSKYFGMSEAGMQLSRYVYDIMPVHVVPSGQQPYGIEGTFVPGAYQHEGQSFSNANSGYLPIAWNGKLLKIMCRADTDDYNDFVDVPFTTRSNLSYSDLPYRWTGSTNQYGVTEASKHRWTAYDFNLSWDELGIVSGFSDDTAKSRSYTLYFLVRFDRNDESIKLDSVPGVSGMNMGLYGSCLVRHRFVDSGRTVEDFRGYTCLYRDFSDHVSYGGNIYAARYRNADSVAESKNGLGALQSGRPTSLDLTAEYVCLNENRPNRNKPGSEYVPWELHTMVDGVFLSNTASDSQRAVRLGPGDYRITSYSVGIIDALGIGDVDSKEDFQVGWADSSVDVLGSRGDIMISVFGSKTLYGDDWKEVGQVTLRDVWGDSNDKTMARLDLNDGFVRLKVVYPDSRMTTRISLRYGVEFLPDGPNVSSAISGLGENDDLVCVNWLAYTAYAPKTSNADLRTSRDNVAQDDTGGVIREDDASHPYPGYSRTVYPYRNFVKTRMLAGSDEVGMCVSQALFDRNGDLVGSALDNQNSPFGLQTVALRGISKVTYSATGLVTDYSADVNLQESIRKRHMADVEAGLDTPWSSTYLRYYVLLPAGLRYVDGSMRAVRDVREVIPFISNVSSLKWDEKGIVGGLQDGCTWVHWGGGGELWLPPAKTQVVDIGNRQLLIVDRTVFDVNQMSGTVYPRGWLGNDCTFWGTGIEFEAEPVDPEAGLPSGSYEALFWSQFLDGDAKASDTKAIPLIDYGGDTYGSASEALGAAGRRVDPYLFGSEEDSVVAISCAFRNFSGSGGTGASLSVKPGAVSADESEYDSMASVELSTEDSVSEYNYALKYETVDNVSENVVLWCNVEGYDRDSSSEWFGKIVGYDVGSTGAQVYVNDMAIVPEDYVTTASSNGKDYTWLTTPGSGWRKADGNWDSVKSVAFWFSGKKFDVNANPSATVYLKMIAPSSIETNSDQSVYTAYNEIFFSDEHKGTGAKGTVLTNSASVDIMLTGPNVPFGNEMPKTGGAGTVLFLLCGAACLVAAGVAYGARRRGDDEQGG